jgi:ubiquinone biosynthesis protein
VDASPVDRNVGAFSDRAPWIIDPDALVWRRGLDGVRARRRADVPRMLEKGHVPPVGRIARTVWSVGGALARWYVRDRRTDSSRAGLSARLRRSFEELGSTYVKLGQIVSGGEGLFPPELVAEFKLLRDRVPAESFADIRAVVESDLGAPLGDIFERFDSAPIAAASIAQVHVARLRTGEEVVVKVQRPQVARLVAADIRAMSWLAPLLIGRIPVAALANPPALVELFAETISEELDFRLEAENMLDIARVLHHSGSSLVIVPRPHPTLVTRRMLVMERLEGFKYEEAEAMRAAGIDTSAVLRSLLISFLEGAMIHGVFHGDLHGGNLFVMRDGRVALLDFGMTGRMVEKQRLAFLRMMVTGATNDLRGQLAAFRDLGAMPEDADLDTLIGVLKLDQAPRDPTLMSGEELVSEIQSVLKGLLAHGARLPKHLMLYVKNMIFFDGAIAQLAPDLDLFAEVTRIWGYFASQHGARIARDLGFDPGLGAIDLTGMKASLGLTSDVETLTHRELIARREKVRERLEEVGATPRI